MSAAARRSARLSYEDARRLVASTEAADRRQVAASEEVRAEFLYLLASDAAVEVRRDVAANPSAPWQADERLVGDADDAVRADLGAKLARLLPTMSARDRAELRTRVISMLETLASDQAVRVRKAVAEAVKDLDCVPRAMINELARDMEFAVADPVLRLSPLLDDADLLAIIASSHAKGALGSIARRAMVGGRVADAIVAADDVGAVATLLANPSAQIREETLDLIVDRAPGRPGWHGPLVDRPALPLRLLQRLASFVAETLLDRLAHRSDLDAAARETVARAVATKLAAADPQAAPETATATAAAKGPIAAAAPTPPAPSGAEHARRLAAAGKLDSDAVSDAIDGGDRAFARAALALLGEIEEATVDRILGARSAKGIVALAWRAKLTPHVAHQLQLRLAAISPRHALGPRGDKWPLNDDEMIWHLEFFGA
jgi:uncharacterized protein (DUF2336 family)